MENMTSDIKARIASLLREDKINGLLWSEATFTATGLPLVSDNTGRTHDVYGIVMSADGGVEAVVSLPVGDNRNGEVMTLSSTQLPAGMKTVATGTPEQWEVLADCMRSALQMVKAQGIENQPRPWW